jgi:hypothetical protein
VTRTFELCGRDRHHYPHVTQLRPVEEIPYEPDEEFDLELFEEVVCPGSGSDAMEVPVTAYFFRGGPRDGELIEVNDAPDRHMPTIRVVAPPPDMRAEFLNDPEGALPLSVDIPVVEYRLTKLVNGSAEYWTDDYRTSQERMQRSDHQRIADLERAVAELRQLLLTDPRLT